MNHEIRLNHENNTHNENCELFYRTDAAQSVYYRYQQYIEITTKIRHNALHAALYIGSVIAEFVNLLAQLACHVRDLTLFCCRKIWKVAFASGNVIVKCAMDV